MLTALCTVSLASQCLTPHCAPILRQCHHPFLVSHWPRLFLSTVTEVQPDARMPSPAQRQCHHHFLEAGIARPLPDAIDGHLQLPRARHRSCAGSKQQTTATSEAAQACNVDDCNVMASVAVQPSAQVQALLCCRPSGAGEGQEVCMHSVCMHTLTHQRVGGRLAQVVVAVS